MQSHIHAEPHLMHKPDSFVGMVSLDTNSPSFREEDRKGLNLVCVIDTSYSMKDGKLDLVKTTLDFIIEHLTIKDRMSVINFGSRANINFDLLKMDREHKEIAKRRVHDMRYDGCTNLSGGLLLGMDVIVQDMKMRCSDLEEEDGVGDNPLYKVMLFTDGEANRGITEMEPLFTAINSVLEDEDVNIPIKPYVDILTFGFGAGHDMKMLSKISDITHNGSYYYVKDQESIGPQFVECLGSLLSLIAQGTILQIKCGLNAGYLVPRVWHSRYLQGENSYVIDIGDVYYGQKRDIVFTFETLFLECELECSLSYFDVIANTYVKDKVCKLEFSSLSSEEEGEGGGEGEVNPEILRNYQRVIVAEGIKEAMEIAETNLESAKEQIKELLGKLTDRVEDDILVEDLRKCLRVMESRSEYMEVGRATLRTMSCEHENQRGSCYVTNYQSVMVNELLNSESYLNRDSRGEVYVNTPHTPHTPHTPPREDS